MSGEKEELVRKVKALVKRNFGGSYERAFRHYSGQHVANPKVDSDELSLMLRDAKIGNGFTRSAWVRGIMKELDKNRDQNISWQEFESGVMN